MGGGRAAAPERPDERAWTTAGLAAHEQLPVWREVASEAFVPVAISRAADGPFMSTVRAREVGPLAVSQIASQAQLVDRTPAGIQRRAGDVFFLNLPLTAGASATQDGRTAELAAGDFVVVDSTRPFQLAFDRPFEQISLAIPHETLAPLLVAPAEVTAVRVRGDTGVGAVAAGAITGLARSSGALDGRAAAALAERLAGLVALALAGVRTPPPSAGRALILQAVLDEVERRLGDPDLSPAQVAERVGISTRYLHRLLSERGPSFGRWVLVRRLERARRDLGDPLRAHWSIADIAREHGFRDPSHFARAFRRHYGLTPRAARARALGRRTAA